MRIRIVAAVAAIITALLLQATLVAPLALPIPASLPAVLVAAVALVDGPGSGMAFGFVCGLGADLGSYHPAGLLALTWLGVGVLAGALADRRGVRADALTAALVCAAASAVATLLLTLVHSGGATAWLALRQLVPAGVLDGLLALAVVPAVRAFLRTDTLRAVQPQLAELRPGPSGG